MRVKLLTKHNLELLSLNRGCTGLSESTLVKMPHCWKSHVAAHIRSVPMSHVLAHFVIICACGMGLWSGHDLFDKFIGGI